MKMNVNFISAPSMKSWTGRIKSLRAEARHSRQVFIGRLRTFVALLLICALTSFQVATMLSMHSHVLADGRIVVHSHATHESGSNGNHSHTDQEFVYLAHAGRLLDSGITADFVSVDLLFAPHGFAILSVFNVTTEDIDDSPVGRSPPSLLS